MPSMANSGWQVEKIANDNAQSSHSKPTQSGATDEGVASSQSTASSTEGNDEDGDGDGNDADGDDRDEDDEAGDGIAPSGSTIDQNGKQAGHISDKSIRGLSCSGEKRKRRLNTPDTPDGDTNPPKALKRPKRPRCSKQFDSTEEEDYYGVDLITDCDDEEEEMEEREESFIVRSEEAYIDSMLNVSQPPRSYSGDWDTSLWTLDHGLDLTDVPYFDNQIGRVEPGEMAEDAEIFRLAGSLQNEPLEILPSLEPRRVRFAEQAIPSTNRARSMLVDQGESATSVHGPENLESDDSCGNSSGYETDLGETTEEEDVSRPVTARPQLLMRRPSISSQNSEGIQTSTSESHSPSKAAGGRRWGPRMACWVTDPTKDMAFIDRNGKSLIFCRALYPPKAREAFPTDLSSGSSTANTSPRRLFPKPATAFDDSERSDFSSQDLIQDGFGSSRQNMALSGLVDETFGTSRARRGHASGPPEMIFFNDLAADSNDQDDGDGPNDGDDKAKCDGMEYLNFSSDSETEDTEGKDQPPPVTAVMSHSSHHDTQTSASNESSVRNLLSHLDTGVVTAFRRSQHHETIPHHLQAGLVAGSAATSMASSPFLASNSLSSVRNRGFGC
ncbi:hypothetical protein MMC07_000802 [Pseudocyphellaria aurata]|nr:hypothetical protein [Pseudocyphellaria aurata]